MENIAVKLVSEFNKIVMVYEKQFDELSEKENLTKLEIAIIGFLANNPAFNTAKDIERIRKFKKSNISTAVDNLNNRGLLTKEVSKSDRRITNLYLTSIANNIVEAIKKIQSGFFEKIFKDKSIIDDFKLLIDKFWGKHSFLAILMHEYSDKSAHYYKDKISKNLLDILFYLRRMSCNLKIGNHAEYGLIGLPNYYLKNFDHGEIKTKEVGKLLRAETMLNKFFTSTYRDIEGIYYDKESAENDTIKYTLYVRKNICGTIRNINFDLESTGTQALLRLLPFLLASIEGSTVIIDEFDSGIHDLLSRSLIKSIFKDISGQLIMTTHNTSLMDNTTSVDNNPSLPDIPAECIYTINEDDSNGQKRISCILEHNNKLNSNSNIRKQYVQGKYHGIPDNISLDFKELTNLLLQNKEEDSVL